MAAEFGLYKKVILGLSPNGIAVYRDHQKEKEFQLKHVSGCGVLENRVGFQTFGALDKFKVEGSKQFCSWLTQFAPKMAQDNWNIVQQLRQDKEAEDKIKDAGVGFGESLLKGAINMGTQFIPNAGVQNAINDMVDNVLDDLADGLMEALDDGDSEDEDATNDALKKMGTNIGKSMLKGVISMGVNQIGNDGVKDALNGMVDNVVDNVVDGATEEKDEREMYDVEELQQCVNSGFAREQRYGRLNGVDQQKINEIIESIHKDMVEVAEQEEKIIQEENENAKKDKAKSIGAEVGKSVLKGAIAMGTN